MFHIYFLPNFQTRRMQAKTSVRNDASVFLNTASLLHQVKMPKQCSYEFRMRSGIWIYVLEFGIFFISLIFNCQSLSYIHHTLVLFSRSIFSCSHLSLLLPFFPPHLSPFLFPPEFPLHIHFLFNFLSLTSFFPSCLSKWKPNLKPTLHYLLMH